MRRSTAALTRHREATSGMTPLDILNASDDKPTPRSKRGALVRVNLLGIGAKPDDAMSGGQNSYMPLSLIFAASASTLLVIILFTFAAYGAAMTYADAKVDARHIPELSFYVGVLASAPLWLAGIWTSTIALVVGARPLFRWSGLGFFVSAAAVFLLMLFQRPDL